MQDMHFKPQRRFRPSTFILHPSSFIPRPALPRPSLLIRSASFGGEPQISLIAQMRKETSLSQIRTRNVANLRGARRLLRQEPRMKHGPTRMGTQLASSEKNPCLICVSSVASSFLNLVAAGPRWVSSVFHLWLLPKLWLRPQTVPCHLRFNSSFPSVL